ncbi:MAG: hypothetical protein MJ025_04210 [Victivallaceae bacterium]|nr:hypothetical protein [Victivallaceae bacterium]
MDIRIPGKRDMKFFSIFGDVDTETAQQHIMQVKMHIAMNMIDSWFHPVFAFLSEHGKDKRYCVFGTTDRGSYEVRGFLVEHGKLDKKVGAALFRDIYRERLLLEQDIPPVTPQNTSDIAEGNVLFRALFFDNRSVRIGCVWYNGNDEWKNLTDICKALYGEWLDVMLPDDEEDEEDEEEQGPDERLYRWHGRTACDICGKSMEDSLHRIDIKHGDSPYTMMCEDCFTEYIVPKLLLNQKQVHEEVYMLQDDGYYYPINAPVWTYTCPSHPRTELWPEKRRTRPGTDEKQ